MKENPSSLAKCRSRSLAACPEQEYRTRRVPTICSKWIYRRAVVTIRDVCWYRFCDVCVCPTDWIRPNQKPEYANESTRIDITYYIIFFLRHFMLFCIVIYVARNIGWINTAYKQLNVRHSIHTLPKLQWMYICFLSQDFGRRSLLMQAGHSPLLGLLMCEPRRYSWLMCTGKRGN